jgi:ABC-2 type transport system permease protein
MMINLQIIALYTLVRREIVRMFRIPSQTFLPSVITSCLYFTIFGAIVGQRIGLLGGHQYNTFIAPGLVMMAVITNAYSNVANSLYIVRFQKSIEEMLVSPMHWSLLLIGYVIGGIVRGLIIGVLVTTVAFFFTDINCSHLPLTFLVLFLVAALFSMAGFLNGMLARTFDEVAFVPTFILTPLIYLGGIFYTTNMLPPFWQHLTIFNPIFYMVSALKYAMLGYSEVSMPLALIIVTGLIFILTLINCILIKKGIGLRD